MKHQLLILLLLCSTCIVRAQDVIITKEGDALKVYNLEVSPTAVFFQESNQEGSPIVRKNKKDLLMIKYQDGRKEIIGDENLTSREAPIKTAEKSNVPMAEATQEDIAANNAIMQRWQAPIPDYTGKMKKKPAILLYCVLRPTTESVFADANVEMTVNSKYKAGESPLPEIQMDEVNYVVTIKNKTKNTIYLDLGNSFFIRGELSEPYYIPTASSSTTGVSNGVGINMGAVAGAMGIGGSVGKLANGITVSNGSSQYNTTTTYSQRVIAVPPMSSKKLEPKVFIPITAEHIDIAPYFSNNIKMASRSRYGTSLQYPHLQNYGNPINIGAVRDYKEGEIPVKLGTFVTYSFTEDIQSPRTLHSIFDIRRIIGVPEHSSLMTFGIPMPMASLKALTPQQQSDLSFMMWQDER